MVEWRAGRKTGRTLWRDEQLVGMVDSPEVALEIVAAMRVVAAMIGPPCGCDPAAGVECRWHMTMITDGSRRESGRERSHDPAVCTCQICQSGEDRYDSRCGVCDALVTVVRGRVEEHGTEEERCIGSGEDAG